MSESFHYANGQTSYCPRAPRIRWPSTAAILRSVVHFHVAAITAMTLFLLVHELWFPRIQGTAIGHNLALIIMPPFFLSLFVCPIAVLVVVCKPRSERSNVWLAVAAELILLWFTVVWILAPCLGSPKPRSSVKDRASIHQMMSSNSPISI